MAVGTLAINLIARTQAFEREMRRSRKQLTSFQRTAKATQKAVMFYASSFLIGGGAIYAMKKFINEASRAEETLNKFNVVFRQQAGAVSRWAETFGDTVGRSTHDVQQWLAGLQDTFVPLGIARDKAADLSKSLVTLAVDVASFNNAADPDVIRDFTSALVGNHETVRKYGIIISEAAMTQEAMNRGLNKTYKQLTDLEKVQLRYALIQKGTTDAQGDAIRSADSYANQMKRLNAQLSELQVLIGEQFLPEVSGALMQLNKFMQEYSSGIRRYLSDFREGVTMARELQGIVNQITKPPWMRAYDLLKGPEEGFVRKPTITNQAAWQRYLAFQKKAQEQAKTIEAGAAPQTGGGLPAEIGTDGGTETPPGMPPMRLYQRYLEELQHDMNNWTGYMKDQWAGLAMDAEGSMGNMFGNMIRDGKNWRDHMAGFFNDIARAASQMAGQAVARQIFGSILGGVAGGAAGGGGGEFTPASYEGVTTYHGGGIVGQMSARRRMSAAAFLGAPRLHGGLRSDEVPAILQKGEQVIPKNEVGGGNVTINVSTPDAAATQRWLWDYRKSIANMMSAARNENHTYGREQR